MIDPRPGREPRRLAVIGANGQLGCDVVSAATDAGHEVLPLTHSDIEITDAAGVHRVLAQLRPAAIVNTASLNHVERCEREPELAYSVNAIGARNVAMAAADVAAALVHVSTDYVFDGEKQSPYVETDPPAPRNVYGATKLAGEEFVRSASDRHFVARTSALYGVHPCRAKPHDNFVRAMLRLGRAGPVRVVSDERVSPTWTADLAAQVIRLLDCGTPGTYHATSDGECSWFEFAQAIFASAGIAAHVEPVSAAEYGSEVRRPPNSVLDNAGLRRLGCDLMPHWRDALRRYLAEIGELSA